MRSVKTSTRKAPKLQLGGFSIPILQVGLIPRLVAVTLPLIEPFADAIGNHASHDGENECEERHQYTPFPLPCLGAATHQV